MSTFESPGGRRAAPQRAPRPAPSRRRRRRAEDVGWARTFKESGTDGCDKSGMGVSENIRIAACPQPVEHVALRLAAACALGERGPARAAAAAAPARRAVPNPHHGHGTRNPGPGPGPGKGMETPGPGEKTTLSRPRHSACNNFHNNIRPMAEKRPAAQPPAPSPAPSQPAHADASKIAVLGFNTSSFQKGSMHWARKWGPRACRANQNCGFRHLLRTNATPTRAQNASSTPF